MWTIDGIELNSRMLLGTAGYPSPKILSNAITGAACDIVTVALRRESGSGPFQGQAFLQLLEKLPVRLLPNTAGCRSAEEAVTVARMAREVFGTHWVKLEITRDEYTLQPDSMELLRATATLIDEGFEVFPYTTEDISVATELERLGCHIIMPWAAPIGSGQGIRNQWALSQLRRVLSKSILIIDAGIGAPSHAALAMEMGFDAVLLNTAVAKSDDPATMAEAFAGAIEAGRKAYESGLMQPRENAVASTPPIDTPFWHLPEASR